MPYNPSPFVLFDDAWLPCRASDAETRPVAVDGIQITWGRDDYISHSTPGTMQFAIYDKTGEFASRVAAKSVIGRRVELWWLGPDGGQQCCFSGRVTAAEAAARQGLTAAAANDKRGAGVVIAVTAAAKDADLGNIVMSPATWPRETLIVRANKIKAAAAPAKIGEFYFYPGSTGIYCWPLDVKGRSLADLTAEFYMSMGDTFSYHPHTNVVRHLYRRAYAGGCYLVQPEPGAMLYVQAANIVYDSQTYKGVGLLGCEITADSGLDLAPNSVVTQVQVSWKNNPGGGANVTTIVNTPEGDTNGRRTVTFTSWMDDGTAIDPMVAEVLARGQYEGALPKHPPVTLDTRPRNGFHTRGEAEVLTLAAETQGMAYLSASPYSAWLGDVTPYFAIIGGTIAYDGGWIITCVLQYVWKTNATTQQTWNDVDHAILWQTDAARQLSDSVTWHDFKFITNFGVYAPS